MRKYAIAILYILISAPLTNCNSQDYQDSRTAPDATNLDSEELGELELGGSTGSGRTGRRSNSRIGDRTGGGDGNIPRPREYGKGPKPQSKPKPPSPSELIDQNFDRLGHIVVT